MVVEMAEFGVMVRAGFNLRWQGKYNGYGFSSILSSVVRPINKTERFIGVAGGWRRPPRMVPINIVVWLMYV